MASLIQFIADRIADHTDDSVMLTRDQQNECWNAGLMVGTARYLELVQAWKVRQFQGKTEEEMIELLIQAVKDRVRSEVEQDFYERDAGEDL